MKKKSKGRVRKFEQENNILRFPEDAATGYEDRNADEDRPQERYNTQDLYTAPLYGNEGYDEEGYDDPDYDPDPDFTRNESYMPSADFDIDAFLAEGWENINRQAAAASTGTGWDEKADWGDRDGGRAGRSRTDRDSNTGESGAGAAQTPHYTAADAYGEQAGDTPGEKSDPMVHRPRTQNKTQDDRKKKRVSARKRRRRLIYLAVVTAALLLVFFTVQNIIGLKMEERELLQEQRELETRKAELEEELTRVDETDYIEQQAREQLHMIKPGEILYLLPEHEEKTDKE